MRTSPVASPAKAVSGIFLLTMHAGYGEPNTLVTGIPLIPIMLVVVFVLPGNTIPPMADLCALPYMVEVFVCVSNGTYRKRALFPVRSGSLGLVVASASRRPFTQVAVDAGSAGTGRRIHHQLRYYVPPADRRSVLRILVSESDHHRCGCHCILRAVLPVQEEQGRFVGYLENAAAAYSAY